MANPGRSVLLKSRSVTSNGVQLFDTKTGRNMIHDLPVQSISIQMDVNAITVAQVELVGLTVDVEAIAHFYLDGKKIRRIEFDDGTAYDFTTGESPKHFTVVSKQESLRFKDKE